MSAIQVRSLHKTYRMGERDVHALRGVDLAIPSGQFCFILGPSGSGKSTLLHLMGALDRPTSGSVTVGGEDLAGLSEGELALFRRRQVGIVFQAFNLLANLDALGNVLVPFLPEGVPAGLREKAIALLNEVGLGDRLAHRPSQLSGGEQQRVAVARALLKDPVLILADEPTGELDSTTGREVFALLRRANSDRKKTVVVVTHDTQYIEEGDRVVQIADGRVRVGREGETASKVTVRMP